MKKLPAVLLCALMLCSLLPATPSEAAVSRYPGIQTDISYWVECTFTNNWGPEYGLKDISRFSIGETLEYINGAFKADPDKKNPIYPLYDDAVNQAYGVYSGTSSIGFFSYADDDAGYIFIPQGNNKYKICTSDGVYIKRTGGTTSINSPKIGSTTDESRATVFKVLANNIGFQIYEEYSTGVGALTLNSDGSLKMKFHSHSSDIFGIALYRKAYSPASYLGGDVMVPGVYTLSYQGPFTPETPQLTFKLPCYYRNEENNPDYLNNMMNLHNCLDVLLTMEGVQAPAHPECYTDQNKNIFVTWTVTLPDAPAGKAQYTYTAQVDSYQDHNWATGMLNHTVVGQEPTCTEEGYRYHPCLNYVGITDDNLNDPSQWNLDNNPCSAYYGKEAIPKLGHDFDTIISTTRASCTMWGKTIGHCTRCDKVTSEDVEPPLGHGYIFHPAKEPTCEDGWEAYYSCSRCSSVFNADKEYISAAPILPAVSAHSYDYFSARESTCTEGGWEAYYRCSVCGKLLDTDMNEIDGVPYTDPDPDAHDWGEAIPELSADSSILIRTRTCGRCGEAESAENQLYGSGTELSPWPIDGEERWSLFASAVECGLDTSGKWFYLPNNIEVGTMIGTQENPFGGTINGNGNTITFLLEASETGKGLFAYASGAVFEHLRVAGTMTTDVDGAGGLVGYASGACTITDCVSSVNISAYGGSGHAGFVGSFGGQDIAIAGSVFDGNITGNSLSDCAGFVGAGDGGVTLYDCVYDGLMNCSGNGQNNTPFFGQNDSVENCYYTNLVGIQLVSGKQPFAVTAEQDVFIEFGVQDDIYGFSGITAYPVGLMRNGVFCAGPDETVTIGLTLSCDIPLGYVFSDYSASEGTLTETDGGWALTLSNGDTVISAVIALPPFGTADFILPSDLTEIRNSAFDGAAMTAVEIPASCTLIGDYAFRNCANLARIRIPAGCQLGLDVFDGCELVLIYGAPGSCAQDYCDSHENCVFVEETQD